MAMRMRYVSLPASAFAAALLIGTAPAAWAQCAAGTGGTMTEDMTTTQSGAGESGTGTSSGTTTGQSGTATAQSDVQTDQGGVTTDETGEQTAQGAATMGQSDTAMAEPDSPEIEGADEKQIASLLEKEGYTDVSSVYSCGAYYEATASKDGQEETLMVDLATGRITPQKQE